VARLTKTIETKSGSVQITDGTEYLHNTLYLVNNTFLRTTPGNQDMENTQGQRIGDKITLSGVSFKFMLELNERYSDVFFRMFLVRKGDTPNSTTLWQGNSGNKMLDDFNTERYSILFSEYVKITSPFFGVQPVGLQHFAECVRKHLSYLLRLSISCKPRETCESSRRSTRR